MLLAILLWLHLLHHWLRRIGNRLHHWLRHHHRLLLIIGTRRRLLVRHRRLLLLLLKWYRPFGIALLWHRRALARH